MLLDFGKRGLIVALLMNVRIKAGEMPKRFFPDTMTIAVRDSKFYIQKKLLCRHSRVIKAFVAGCEARKVTKIVYHLNKYFEPAAVYHVLQAVRTGRYGNRTTGNPAGDMRDHLNALREEAIFHFDAALLAHIWGMDDIFKHAQNAILSRIDIKTDPDTYCSVITDIHENGLIPRFVNPIKDRFAAMGRWEFWAAIQHDNFAILQMSPPLRPIILQYLLECGGVSADEISESKLELIQPDSTYFEALRVGYNNPGSDSGSGSNTTPNS